MKRMSIHGFSMLSDQRTLKKQTQILLPVGSWVIGYQLKERRSCTPRNWIGCGVTCFVKRSHLFGLANLASVTLLGHPLIPSGSCCGIITQNKEGLLAHMVGWIGRIGNLVVFRLVVRVVRLATQKPTVSSIAVTRAQLTVIMLLR